MYPLLDPKICKAVWELSDSIDGWTSGWERAHLAHLALGRVVLEIGSYKGRSTVAMAPYAKELHCIDHFHPGPIGQGYEPDTPGVRGEFEQNIAPWRGKINIYEMLTEDAANLAFPPIGFLFIDGGHDYETALADIDHFTRFVIHGGIVAVHDAIGPFREVDVERAIKDSVLNSWVEMESWRMITIRVFVNI